MRRGTLQDKYPVEVSKLDVEILNLQPSTRQRSMKPNYRRCVSCRKVGHKQDFWRIVRIYPSGQLQLDQGMGRSAYLCVQESCLMAARKKNRLGRALKASVPEELYQVLGQRLVGILAVDKLQIGSDSTRTQNPPPQ